MLPEREAPSPSRAERIRECCSDFGSGSKAFCSSFFDSSWRHFRYVVGYNWLVTITFVPWYLLLVGGAWLLRHEAMEKSVVHPVAIACCIGYLLLETTFWWMERCWSGVAACTFWRLGAVFLALYASLSCTLLHNDALACLMLFTVCLGLRETAYQYLCYYHDGMGLKERITAAFMGGFTFCLIICSLISTVYLLTRLAYENDAVLSAATSDLLYVLILPVLRFLARLILTQFISSSIVGPHHFDVQLGPDDMVKPGKFKPQLDALVVYADFIFALYCALEAPFAIVLLLVPQMFPFCLAVCVNALLDVLFISVLDTLQQRRLRPVQGFAPGTEEADQWAPSYVERRRPSMVAVAMSGSYTASESTPIAPRTSSATQATDGAGDPEKDIDEASSSGWCNRLCAMCPSWGKSESDARDDPAPSTLMSPRVSHLLDEYDSMVVQNRESYQASWKYRSSPTLYLYQERKITFTTHLLGSFLACIFSVTAVAFLRIGAFPAHELAARIILVIVMRIVIDFGSCWAFEYICKEIRPHRRAVLWECRQELATIHGWLLRLLFAMCPVIPILIACL